MISAQEISFAVKHTLLVNKVSVHIAPGEFVVVMGPNGAGKSTLLKMMAGAIQPLTGKILFRNKELSQYTPQDLAKARAVLSQHYHISFPMKAYDIVMMGRYPYFNSRPGPSDEQIVHEALDTMQMSTLSDRWYHTLSGGEAQKIQMCRVLAQIGKVTADEPKLLVLDEPVSHLDIKYQHQLLQQARLLCTKKVAVIAVLHDINLALKYADRILFMKEAAVVKELSKNEIPGTDLLKEVFDVDATVFPIPGEAGVFVSF
jgi:iron complex transport system ATP-binding protein